MSCWRKGHAGTGGILKTFMPFVRAGGSRSPCCRCGICGICGIVIGKAVRVFKDLAV
jgi:hypothetical protein